ncbi:MAG: chemotaxis protein CheA [Candidatus Altiarchaeales archaeon ex4484_96]|nr:MAG: chemotaxis protein CheA [Candidatus Altiarchaeales archaeon ex4484_96]
MADDMQEYLDLYLSEAEDLLQSLNESLLEFEKNPKKKEYIDEIQRCAHTLKSSSASMGYYQISELAHHMEDVLESIKKDEIDVNAYVVDIVFECFDVLERGVDNVRKGKPEPDVSNVIKHLDNIKEGRLKELNEDAEGGDLADKPHTLKAVHSIKVDVENLDKLLEVVGELLIAKMRLQNINSYIKDKDLDDLTTVLSRLIDDVQYQITEARMIPVDHIFSRFPRMVRDIAKREGKKVNFIIRGNEIKLDRTILDKIGEPLIHLLRNAVDHGIEQPDKRKNNDKSEAGTIKLTARRERNGAVIEVEDDGEGFDLEAIKEVALDKGLYNLTTLQLMSEQELLELPFHPNFSTSRKVTDVSGRGVGLDVVKTRIEELNGTLKMESKKNKGTKFILTLPLSLAIIKSLLIEVCDRTYVIPISNVLRILPSKETHIKHIEGNECIVLDEEAIPIVRIKNKFNIEGLSPEENFVIIIEKGNDKVGVVADKIVGQQEIMIKALDKELRELKGIAGASILSDGSLALVIDISGIT